MRNLVFSLTIFCICTIAASATWGQQTTTAPTGATLTTGNQSVNAAAFRGAHWTDKVTSAAAAVGANGGTIIVPDSIADNGSATTLQVPSNVTLEFPGNGTFTFCSISMGKFSKMTASAGASLIESGTGCSGVQFVGATPTLQDSDHPSLHGIRIGCNRQPSSTGITIGPGASGGTAMYDLEDVEVTGCTAVGILATQMQFSHWRNVHLQQNYVNLKLYGSGAGSSNIFDGLKTDSNGSGVNVIVVNNSNTQDAGGNVFINPQLQNGTVASMAVIGDAGDYSPNVVIIGSQPELNSPCPGSVTIDSRTIPCSGALYASSATVYWFDPNFADASASPDINLVNGASLTLTDPSGYGSQFGQLIVSDATSFVNLQGNVTNFGSIQNVTSWPTSISGGRGAIAGSPVSVLNPNVPNFFTGNVLVPAFATTTGTSSNAIAVDPMYGPVNTVTFAASAGSPSNNYVTVTNLVTSGATSVTSDYFFSVLAKASVTTSMEVYCHYATGDLGFKYKPITLIGGQWTRVVGYNFNVPSGSECDLGAFPNDSAGATVSFTRIEAFAYPSTSGTGIAGGVSSPASAMARTMVIHEGAVNPNGVVPTFPIAGTNNSSLVTFDASLASGSAASFDRFTVQNVCGSGANPTCRLTFGHPSGTSGFAGYNFPAFSTNWVGGSISSTSFSLNPGVNISLSGSSAILGSGTEAAIKDYAIQSSLANATTTGTTQFKLVKLTGAPSTAVIATIADTHGILGICDSACGTSGAPIIAVSGVETCSFDGATTAGDYVQISSTTGGDCHDTGATTVPSSGEIIGRALTTNSSAGNASLFLILKDQ
jgi:hypothetical protein